MWCILFFKGRENIANVLGSIPPKGPDRYLYQEEGEEEEGYLGLISDRSKPGEGRGV